MCGVELATLIHLDIESPAGHHALTARASGPAGTVAPLMIRIPASRHAKQYISRSARRGRKWATALRESATLPRPTRVERALYRPKDEQGAPRCGGRPCRVGCSNSADGCGLGALGALANLELHPLAFLETAEARSLDFGEVDEDVGAAVLGDEAVALVRVEP